MNKPKTNKNQPLLDLIASRGIKRNFVAKNAGLSYGRMITILRGADVYLHEAVNLSKIFEKPIENIFPHLFHTQSNNTKPNSHE